MIIIHKSWRELLEDCLIIACVSGTVGIALKFTTLFNIWVLFPVWPNVCDVAFLIFSSLFLGWLARKHIGKVKD
jgi:hypothetical protein